MATYNDIFVRDAFGDTGQVPYTGAYYWTSPDIIPQQLNVLTCTQLQNSYNGADMGMNVNAQQSNNIYVRCLNLGSQPSSGTITLYWCNSSLFMNPAQWWNQVVGTVNISPASLGSNQIGCGQNAIVWNAPTVPSGFHYCLIAIVQTPNHPIAQPNITTNAQFVTWVLNNPAVCFRNVTLVNASLPSFQQAATFENLDSAEEQFIFMVQGTNWPDNTSVNIQCTDVGFNFNYTQSFGSAPQSVSTIQTVPAEFSGTVLITITPPTGSVVPPSATANFSYGPVTTEDSDPELAQYALPGALHGALGEHATLSIVILGQCTMLCSGS